MRELSLEQEFELLKNQVSKIRSAGCPETYRLPERAWRIIHEALIIATRHPGPDAMPQAMAPMAAHGS